MLSKFKQMQLKANSAQDAIDKMERMERDVKAKYIELADMIRERDRARFEVDRQNAVRVIWRVIVDLLILVQSHKDEIERLRRELDFANERAEDASRASRLTVRKLCV